MKKNKMMRLASGLLVAVLITTSTISGTFAKYVTEDSATDSARVAKFGVVVTADGSLFENSYKDAPVTGDTATVVAGDSADVVAPGTNNADGAFTFSITGTPEVDVKVTVAVEATEDVFLNPGTYPKMTTGDKTDTFVVTDKYSPIKYTLKNKGVVYNDGTDDIEDVTLDRLKAALVGLSETKIDANENLATLFGDYEITWKWDFYNDAETDMKDTLLGNFAADAAAVNAEAAALGIGAYSEGMSSSYNLGVDLEITVTVEQID